MGKLSNLVIGKGRQSVFSNRLSVFILLFVVSTLVGSYSLCLAATDGSGGISPDERIIPRKILAVYNSEEGQKADQNTWRRGFDMAANYYGLLTEYRDVTLFTLPDGASAKRSSKSDAEGVSIATDLSPAIWRAVVVCGEAPDFVGEVPFIQWLDRQSKRGIKVVFLCNAGVIAEPDEPHYAALMRIISRMGLQYTPAQSTAGFLFHYAHVGEHMQFERQLPAIPPIYDDYKSAGDVTPWLSVAKKGAPASEGLVVATSAGGGIILPQYLYWVNPGDFRHKWYLDPFPFVQEAFGTDAAPVPTPTTLNGRRLGFSHIDADGFAGFSNVDKASFCAQVLYDNVLRDLDFPVSVSVIQAEVDPDYKGNERLMTLARTMFAQPHIEAASHSFSHPYFWDANDEEKAAYFKKTLGVSQYGVPVEGYVFDVKTETVDSCQWITDKLTPKGKPCRLMQWSGSCDPRIDSMKLLAEAGISNINGGDTMYDDHNDSLTSVSPLFIYVGDSPSFVQVFTGQANENILTNLWTGPYHAFKYIVQTMKRTGTPRRLMPVNVYYHFYSAEYEASLEAIRTVYDWVKKQPLAPVHTLEYGRMVTDFTKADVRELVDGSGYTVSGYGYCLSLRLDAKDRLPDLVKSKNILGYSVQPEGLFVHLVPNATKAVLKLRKKSEVDKKRGLDVPYVVESSGWVMPHTGLAGGKSPHKGKSLSFAYNGFGDEGVVVIGGLQPSVMYSTTFSSGSSVRQERNVRTDEKGWLKLTGLASGTVEMRK